MQACTLYNSMCTEYPVPLSRKKRGSFHKMMSKSFQSYLKPPHLFNKNTRPLSNLLGNMIIKDSNKLFSRISDTKIGFVWFLNTFYTENSHDEYQLFTFLFHVCVLHLAKRYLECLQITIFCFKKNHVFHLHCRYIKKSPFLTFCIIQ